MEGCAQILPVIDLDFQLFIRAFRHFKRRFYCNGIVCYVDLILYFNVIVICWECKLYDIFSPEFSRFCLMKFGFVNF